MKGEASSEGPPLHSAGAVLPDFNLEDLPASKPPLIHQPQMCVVQCSRQNGGHCCDFLLPLLLSLLSPPPFSPSSHSPSHLPSPPLFLLPLPSPLSPSPSLLPPSPISSPSPSPLPAPSLSYLLPLPIPAPSLSYLLPLTSPCSLPLLSPPLLLLPLFLPSFLPSDPMSPHLHCLSLKLPFLGQSK